MTGHAPRAARGSIVTGVAAALVALAWFLTTYDTFTRNPAAGGGNASVFALVLGLLLLCLWGSSFARAVCALVHIKRRRLDGRGTAIAGLLLGIVGPVLGCVVGSMITSALVR